MVLSRDFVTNKQIHAIEPGCPPYFRRGQDEIACLIIREELWVIVGYQF